MAILEQVKQRVVVVASVRPGREQETGGAVTAAGAPVSPANGRDRVMAPVVVVAVAVAVA